jgi:hypothetical protein
LTKAPGETGAFVQVGRRKRNLLQFMRCTDGANLFTIAAVFAQSRIDIVNISLGGDSVFGAFGFAGAAGDTIGADLVCHGLNPFFLNGFKLR